MDSTLAPLFTNAVVRRFDQFSGRISECLHRLSEEQVWAKGSTNENAVGNLVMHLTGNVRQWILSGVGGEPDHRVRDLEFDTTGGLSKTELFARLEEAVKQACLIIQALKSNDLAGRRTIQGYEVTVLEAVLHVIEHYALHTGQIIFATKMMTQDDLGFYKHLGKGARQIHREKTP